MSGCAAQRPEDPVVLTGSDVPRLAGAQPGKVLAYRYFNGTWDQVPVQVDERAMVDLGKVYNQAANGVQVLTYNDPGTFTGPDPDASVDANDEIAFMGIDAGNQAPAGQSPPNVVAGSGEEIRVHDPVGDPTRRLRVPVPADRQPRPRRGPELRRLPVQPALGRLQVDLPAQRRAQPGGLDGHDELLQPALLGSLGRRRAAAADQGRHRGRHPRPPQGPVRARQLRAQRGHLRRRRGRVHRQQERPGAGDPLLHRRQQWAADRPPARLL